MSDEPLDLDDELEVDALCGRFESARRAGETLDVPAFVAAAPARLRERLEEELTALETELAAADDAAPVPAALPARLGRYRVVAKIGEGGMGAVYEAVQDRPRRRVALKVVRAELTSPATTRRFDREVKLLGHLHHPGIAQIFEAGVEPARDGRPAIPYLVMELVRGEPLLAHAAERALDVRGRLELVRRICDAVQHAHDQGVVHRDLKPADILVIADDRSSTTRGGAGFVDLGRPKVLDFGVARATGEDAPQTLETRVGQLVGTISHMSPEQLEGDSAAVDERADVYAIGVILYELLAGRLPHDVSGLSLPAAIERIRTEEPTRLGLVDPRLRGDVEVIVARAMEKDRRRRYPSALELAADLQRHLDDEPIRARPPAAADRLRKFARRNRALFAGLSTAAGALVVALVVVSGFALRQAALRAEAEAARDDARREADKAAAVSEFLVDTLARANLDAGGNPRETTLLAVLDGAGAEIEGAFPDQPLVEATLRRTIGRAYSSLTELDRAEDHLRRALELRTGALGRDHEDVAEAEHRLADALERKGEYAEAERLVRHALAVLRARRPGDDAEVAGLQIDLAGLLERRGALDEAEAAYRESLAVRERLSGPGSLDVANASNNLASHLQVRGEFAEAERLFRRALAIRRARLAAPDQRLANSLNNLGVFLAQRGDRDAAEPFFREALAMREQLFPPDHPHVLEVVGNLGAVALGRGDLAEAERRFRRAADATASSLGGEHPSALSWRVNLANAVHRRGRLDEARELLVTAADGFRATSGADHPSTLWATYWLAIVEAARGDLESAERLQRDVVEARRRVLGDHPSTARSLQELAAVVARLDRRDEAVTLLREGVERCERAVGEDHRDTLEIRLRLAEGLAEVGVRAEVEAIVRDVEARAGGVPSDDPLRVRLAALRAALGGE